VSTPTASTFTLAKQKLDQQKPSVEEPAITFQKLSAAEPVKYYKVAIHGRPKSGKTRFGLTCPPPVYIIETEPGLRPLIKLFPNKEIYFVDVYTPDYSGVFESDSTKTLSNIDAAVKLIRGMVAKDPSSVGTVVVDSVTDVYKWVMEWMKVEILKIDKTARVRQQWDYQYSNSKYQNIIMQLVALPTHLVITAQDKEEYAGAGQPTGVYEPSWQWQTPQWVDIIMGLVKFRDPKTQCIEYTSTIEDSRHMDEKLEPIAGIEIKNPTFDKLLEVLKKKV
jgi:hypothetical protein